MHVNGVIVFAAQYLLYGMVLVAGLVWLSRDKAGKWLLAGEAVVGLALVGIGIWVAGTLHADPRPFVHDPASAPLFPHPADNGFPSDHSAAAALLAALVLRHQRLVGAVLAAAAVLVAVARVAAHVHHGQDVVAGLAVGLVAAVVAGLLVDRGARVLSHRRKVGPSR